MISKVTKTTNRLHFSDLDPIRFEDLCLNIVYRMKSGAKINHYGRNGNDGGIDIEVLEEINSQIKRLYVQCKRYSKIQKNDIKKVIDKIKDSPPQKLLLIVSCDVSKANNEFLQSYGKEVGINEIEIWTGSTLEAKLYDQYKDLLFTYFGISQTTKQISREAIVKHSIRMEKSLRKDLYNKKFMENPENFNKALKDPSYQFISDRVIIRSVDDTSYPSINENSEYSTWFREYLYDFYHNGLEIWLGATLGYKAFLDERGYWEPLITLKDLERKNPSLEKIYIKMIGQIPFENIVDYKVDGDGIYGDPQIFCKFNINNRPFEKICYRTYGYHRNEPDFPLEERFQTKFE